MASPRVALRFIGTVEDIDAHVAELTRDMTEPDKLRLWSIITLFLHALVVTPPWQTPGELRPVLSQAFETVKGFLDLPGDERARFARLSRRFCERSSFSEASSPVAKYMTLHLGHQLLLMFLALAFRHVEEHPGSPALVVIITEAVLGYLFKEGDPARMREALQELAQKGDFARNTDGWLLLSRLKHAIDSGVD